MDVSEAASLLACSQVVLVNVGINRPVESRAQWSYFYDAEICFARLSYPAHFSPTMVPAGCGSIQAEVYFSEKWRPLTKAPEDWIEPTIDGLIECGLVRSRDEVIHRSVIFAPFANVIFDYDRPKSLKLVHEFLDSIGIGYCGRYGDWAYIWTDQAFKSGEASRGSCTEPALGAWLSVVAATHRLSPAASKRSSGNAVHTLGRTLSLRLDLRTGEVVRIRPEPKSP